MNKFAGNQIGKGSNVGSSNTKIPRLGELLIAANIIKPTVLDESLQIAKTSKTMIGRTLISLGQLDEHKLQTALAVQGLIRMGTINTQFGIKALSIACSSSISIEDALHKLGWQPKGNDAQHENEIVSLMLDAGLVNKQVLETIETQSISNNLSLGRCLVVNRHITQNRLEAVLSAQFLIKDSQITRDQAIEAIKKSVSKRQPIESSLMEFGIRALADSEIRLSNLIRLAGLVSDVDKLNALEKALNAELPLTTILIEDEILNPETLENALNLQRQVFSGTISLNQAAKMLERYQSESINIEEQIAKSQAQGPAVNQAEQLVELFIASGFLTEANVNEAGDLAKTQNKRLGEILLSKHQINQSYLDTAWHAQKMLDDRLINIEYACKALRKFLDPNADKNSPQASPIPNSNYSDAPTPPPKTWSQKLLAKIFKK